MKPYSYFFIWSDIQNCMIAVIYNLRSPALIHVRHGLHWGKNTRIWLVNCFCLKNSENFIDCGRPGCGYSEIVVVCAYLHLWCFCPVFVELFCCAWLCVQLTGDVTYSLSVLLCFMVFFNQLLLLIFCWYFLLQNCWCCFFGLR